MHTDTILLLALASVNLVIGAGAMYLLATDDGDRPSPRAPVRRPNRRQRRGMRAGTKTRSALDNAAILFSGPGH